MKIGCLAWRSSTASHCLAFFRLRVNMADPFIGEIRGVAFNFAPKGWALCNGQLMPIGTNTALFSLLGTTYGGDGKSNFALPDIQSRILIGIGQGPGLVDYQLGNHGGV